MNRQNSISIEIPFKILNPKNAQLNKQINDDEFDNIFEDFQDN